MGLAKSIYKGVNILVKNIKYYYYRGRLCSKTDSSIYLKITNSKLYKKSKSVVDISFKYKINKKIFSNL